MIHEIMQNVQRLRPIDDVCFELLAEDKGVCEEILRTILDDDGLVVEDVIVQKSERNIYGRSVRLDALCTLSSGVKCNIEVQRFDNDDHVKRARYNESVITARTTEPGERFENIPTLIVVYISAFDFLGKGKTLYHIDKVIRETGDVVDDGVSEVFVNAQVNDGTKVSDLMRCMLQERVNDPKFPRMSNRMSEIKDTERGRQSMCKILEEYINENKDKWLDKGRAEGRVEGRVEGRYEERISSIRNLHQNAGFAAEKIATLLNLSEEEVEDALKV